MTEVHVALAVRRDAWLGARRERQHRIVLSRALQLPARCEATHRVKESLAGLPERFVLGRLSPDAPLALPVGPLRSGHPGAAASSLLAHNIRLLLLTFCSALVLALW